MYHRGSLALLITLLSVCFSVTIYAEASESPFPGIAAGDPEILTLVQTASVDAKPTVTVLEKDENGMLLEFELPGLAVQALEVESETFHALEIAGGAFRGEEGEPMLPTYSRLMQIPDGVGVSFVVENTEKAEFSGFRPVPMQPGKIDDFRFSADAYARSGYDAIPAVIFGEPAIARDLRVVPLTFNPVRYDPASGTIEVTSRVEVRINFEGTDNRNPAPEPRAIVPESFHNLYQDLVVNYEGLRDDQTLGLGMYVVICPNNSTVINLLQPLLDWRERKGYDVYLATTAETGTSNSSIKSWIQTAYNTWPNPPAHITLVGDTGGTIAIPHWSENYSSYNGASDFPYVMLEGSDPLGDAHIGRISVSSTTELERYVSVVSNVFDFNINQM